MNVNPPKCWIQDSERLHIHLDKGLNAFEYFILVIILFNTITLSMYDYSDRNS